MGRKFTVTVPVTHTFEEGYGVAVVPIFDSETESVSDIDVEVVPIREGLITLSGTVPVVPSPSTSGMFYPVENFARLGDPGEVEYDDTHDLRDRFFDTEDEARSHADYTEGRFRNPSPWESFVRI